ncbi:unnamed protein product [Trichogramma brassicae]|uniref:Ribosomal protein eL8/eL30/eS12/Gadd45 domain-containing protein n=1 Tax=Trichogramma brassicae TaxID=86971 RepID=A0A6H5IEE9_9HYME|nr:H/ACA ribonucleoprotein complex subunit 2-like protein [Trichogramma pretiosum]CAB0034059.1 unnamed protein product [Trichogramma brassicae]
MTKETSIKMETNEDLNETVDIKEEGEESYEEKIKNCNSIATPLMPKKLAKKVYKLIKNAYKTKNCVRAGLKDVQKHIRKGETGIVIFAGDVFPIDIMCHLPVVCEDKNIPYAFSPSRYDIGECLGVKRGSLMVLIKEDPSYEDSYKKIKSSLEALARESLQK